MAIRSNDVKDHMEARILFKEATDKSTQKFPPWGGEQRMEEAAELYTRSGNLFKANRQPIEAETAYLESAKCSLCIKNLYDAATNFNSAANAIRKIDPMRSAGHLRVAAIHQVSNGHFSVASKTLQDAGELYIQEGDTVNAIECLRSASDYYESENRPINANTCLLKVAQMFATTERYDEAIEIYEKVATTSIDSLSKWTIKDHLFKASLCHLCKGDIIGTRRAVERYCEIDVTYATQRENKLITAIGEAFENYDVDAFTTII